MGDLAPSQTIHNHGWTEPYTHEMGEPSFIGNSEVPLSQTPIAKGKGCEANELTGVPRW